MPHQCTSCARQFADGSKEMLSGCPDCGGSKFQFMPSGGAPAAEEPPSPPERGTGTVTETVGHVATKLRDFVGDDPGPPAGRARDDASGTGDGGGPATASATRVEPDTTGRSGNTADRDGPAADGSSTEPTTDGASSDGLDDSDGPAATPEDGAQSTARSQMVSPEELPDGPDYVGTGNDGDLQAAADRNPGVSTDQDVQRGTDRDVLARTGRDVQPGTAGDAEPTTDGDVQPTTDEDAASEGRVVGTPADDSPDLADLREELNDQFEGIRITEPGQYELNLMELYEREETIIALQENGRYVIEPPESWRGDESV